MMVHDYVLPSLKEVKIFLDNQNVFAIKSKNINLTKLII